MGSILHYFDFDQAVMSQRLAHKRHGLEAPRNSLEYPTEASKVYRVAHKNIPYSDQVKQHSSKMNYCFSGIPVKKLIENEMSNQINSRRNMPSVVARLMGVETLPSEIDPAFHSKRLGEDERTIERKKLLESSSAHNSSLDLAADKQTKYRLLHYCNNLGSSQSTRCLRLTKATKPRAREHPQEEQLQKFKKEFEAWQASKLQEHSGALELDHNLQEGKDNQILAQKYLNKEKMEKYMGTKRNFTEKKTLESEEVVSTSKQKIDIRQGDGVQYYGCTGEHSELHLKNSMATRVEEKITDFADLTAAKLNEKPETSYSPTRIVVLKPSSERSNAVEEPQVGSSEVSGREYSMEDFLEEVKQRLKYEIQGRAKRNTIARGTRSGTLVSERSTDPKQIARSIAKQIRESVTRDIGMTLMRSESTSSYTSEAEINLPDSPELITRGTRKLVSERLKNVLENEIELEEPVVNNRKSGASILIKDRARLKSMSDVPQMDRHVDFWEDKRAVSESTFRHKRENNVAFEAEALSQQNLVRSFSAPASRTTFGKLLLEDQHVMTGVHIHRKHEASEHKSAGMRKIRKDGFNIKSRVSYLKHNLSLKGNKLFRKKTNLSKESVGSEFKIVKAVVIEPSVVMNSGITQDNSTEVPPSPASVSSGSQDELCKSDYPSPVSPLGPAPLSPLDPCPGSPLEVPVVEFHLSSHISVDLSSKLQETSLPEQVENSGSEQAVEQTYNDEAVDIDSYYAAYLEDILVTAGLYEGGSLCQADSGWNVVTNHIPNQVFEELEEAYGKYLELDNAAFLLQQGHKNIGHRLFFDLVNDALPVVLGTTNSSMFRIWVLGATPMPCGKRLYEDLWHQICRYIDLPFDESQTIDSMVAGDIRKTSLSSMSYEDIDTVGREIERCILADLIDDFFSDMCIS